MTSFGVVKKYFPTVLTYEDDACFLWPFSLDTKGYGQIHWEGKVRRVHNLVCELTHGPAPAGKKEAAHRCGVRRCVNKRHLRWTDRRTNALECAYPRGEGSHLAKLTAERVEAIRAAPGLQREIAARFGVSQITVSRIKRGETWRHLN